MSRPTEKQKAARARNWRIRNLRALAAQVRLLTGERYKTALAAIDAELSLIGAKTTDQHRDEVIAKHGGWL